MSTPSGQNPTHAIGPASYENFRAFNAGLPHLAIAEVNLYSDVDFTGEVWPAVGPVALLNPIRKDSGRVGASLVLRCSLHEEQTYPRNWSSKSDLTRFTGSSLFDELACLLSLQYGSRLLAGSAVRWFDGRDPLGRPRADTDAPNLYLSTRSGSSLLPWVSQPKQIGSGLLPLLGALAPCQALTLIRAARSYRDALWIADEDPQLAWLLFVSAAETVAVHVAVPTEQSAETTLREAAPAVAEAIEAFGPSALSKVAPQLAHLFKSTARFLSFFQRYQPPPPERRPPEGYRFQPWEGGLRTALSAVYDWRSKALHAGIPFPPPMCEAPYFVRDDWEAPCETVPGLAAMTQGGVWTRDQMPFGLHLFEYLVRTSLLAWWASVSTPPVT